MARMPLDTCARQMKNRGQAALEKSRKFAVLVAGMGHPDSSDGTTSESLRERMRNPQAVTLL